MLGVKALARAKVNLFLDVGSRREDGFHQVATIMQTLDLSDELYFRRTGGPGDRISIRCSDPGVPCGPENTVWKAAEVFFRQAGAARSGGVEVFINKRIPIGAGLAGGSADGAAALLAMDRVWETALPPSRLEALGAMIGSDVPFCLGGGTVLATGRGEILERLRPLPPYQVVLASPGKEVSTREVYESFDLLPGAGTFPCHPGALESMLKAVEEQDFKALCRGLSNRLEEAAGNREETAFFKDTAIRYGAGGALMTGSGPTVFALAEGLETAAGTAWELGQVAPLTIVTSFADRGAEVIALSG